MSFHLAVLGCAAGHAGPLATETLGHPLSAVRAGGPGGVPLGGRGKGRARAGQHDCAKPGQLWSLGRLGPGLWDSCLCGNNFPATRPMNMASSAGPIPIPQRFHAPASPSPSSPELGGLGRMEGGMRIRRWSTAPGSKYLSPCDIRMTPASEPSPAGQCDRASPQPSPIAPPPSRLVSPAARSRGTKIQRCLAGRRPNGGRDQPGPFVRCQARWFDRASAHLCPHNASLAHGDDGYRKASSASPTAQVHSISRMDDRGNCQCRSWGSKCRQPLTCALLKRHRCAVRLSTRH